MTPDLPTLHIRLTSVRRSLVPPAQIEKAGAAGRSWQDSSILAFLQTVLRLSRQNPVLGAAFAIGAFEGATLAEREPQRTAAQLGLGVALTWWGYYHEALALLTELIDRSPPDAEVERLYAEWPRLLCERRVRQAAGLFDSLMGIAERLEAMGDTPNAMRCRLDAVSGMYLPSADGQPEAALGQAMAYFSEGKHLGETGLGLILLAYLHLNRGAFRSAHEQVDRAERALRQAHSPAMTGYTWLVRGTILYHQRRIQEADLWLRKARQRFYGLQHEYYLALSLFTLAGLRYEAGNLPGATRCVSALRKLTVTPHIKLVEANAEMHAGHVSVRRGRYEDAERCYHKAIQLFTVAGYDVLAKAGLMNLGIVARRKGQFGRSLDWLNEALATFEESDALEYAALAHHNLSKTYASFGYFEPAIEHSRMGIHILEQAGITVQAVRPAIYLARLLAECGQAEEAHRLLDTASRRASEAGLDMDQAICGQVRGVVLRAEGRLDEATAAYQGSVDALTRLEQWDAAWESRIGIAEASAELGKMRAAQGQLRTLARVRLPAGLRWRYDGVKGQIAALQHRPDKALAAYLSALQHACDARRSLEWEEHSERFVQSLEPLYERAFGAALELNRPETALALAEIHGAQLLSVRLGHESSFMGDAHDLPAMVTGRMRVRLGDSWTIFRYAWHRNGLWLFVLHPSGLEYYPIPLRDHRLALQMCSSPDDSFRRFAYLDNAGTPDDPHPISANFRRQLFESLVPEATRNRLRPDHTLVVVPSHRMLYGLPFQALLDGNEPLILRTQILYAQSLDILRIALERDSPSPVLAGRGLVCAQSTFPDLRYAPLPHVRAEAQAIISTAINEVTCLIDEAASRDRLIEMGGSGELAGFAWLHFATHAAYDPATGAFTGLIVGSDRVGLEEITRWKLSAGLVTLSACQAGSGRWYSGDEVASLAHAFLGARAHTVVASLWLVADEATAPLMANFYRSMRDGLSPTESLACAQREAHRAGMDAYYWASFSAFGGC